MSSKQILSAIAIALTILAFYPYIRSILRGQTRPHVFSWIIWSLTTCIVFLAQWQADGGAGAWPVGCSAVITAGVAILGALKAADIQITGSDWGFLLAALASLPLWYLTADAVWAVVLLTGIDILGFGPTLAKVYRSPFSEDMLFYLLYCLRNILVLFALENYSVTTVLFPLAVGSACLLLLVLLVWRRRLLPRAGVGSEQQSCAND